MRWWCASPYTELSGSLPTYREENSVLVPALSEEELTACQKSCAAFIQWLDASGDDDEEDDDDDEEEDDSDVRLSVRARLPVCCH